MAPVKVPDSRWIRRYRKYLLCGSGIMCIQVLLAYAFFSLDSDNVGTISEPREVSGKGRSNVEVMSLCVTSFHSFLFCDALILDAFQMKRFIIQRMVLSAS